MVTKARDVILTDRLIRNFWQKVEKDETTGCWLWIGTIKQDGYGVLTAGQHCEYRAHRVSYCLHHHIMNLPDKLELDHLCRNRRCVNPAHLEAVTHRENFLRGRSVEVTQKRYAAITHCPHGHAYSGENLVSLRIGKYLSRGCKTCIRMNSARRQRAYQARKRQARDANG